MFFLQSTAFEMAEGGGNKDTAKQDLVGYCHLKTKQMVLAEVFTPLLSLTNQPMERQCDIIPALPNPADRAKFWV